MRFFAALLTILIMGTTMPPAGAFAAGAPLTPLEWQNGVWRENGDYILFHHVFGIQTLRGEIRVVDGYPNPIPLYMGKVPMVPVRALAEFMGYDVVWDEISQTARLTHNWKTHNFPTEEIRLTVGDPRATIKQRGVDYEVPLLDVSGFAPSIRGDRMFVPLQFALDYFPLFYNQLQLMWKTEEGLLLRESSPG